MKAILTLHIVLCVCSFQAFAQSADSLRTDSSAVQSMPADTLQTPPEGIEDSEQEAKPVIPWRETLNTWDEKVVGDSLLRWQLWPNWGDFQAYRREVISYRLGSIGRMDAFSINGYGPYDQRLSMEGISLNNPLTGLPNYNLVPHRKIGNVSESMFGSYDSKIQLRDYYILKPISYLNYDESSGAYRNLEFLVAQNFTKRTNVELSYWDRRGGGYYPNSDVEGSQVVGRVYHHLNERYLIRSMYMRNQLSKGEPLGYLVQDPALFSFDEFLSTPNSSFANSEFNRWDLVTGIYHRTDTSAAEDAGLEILTSKNTYNLFLASDTLSWDIRTVGGALFKTFNIQDLTLKMDLSANWHSESKGLLSSDDQWAEYGGKVSMAYELASALKIYGSGDISLRSDDQSAYDVGGGLKGELGEMGSYDLSYSVYEQLPSMQAMYWNSKTYAGNAALNNERGMVLNGSIDARLGRTVSLGVRGNLRNAIGRTFLTPDSSFTNSNDFQQISGTVFARFENKLLELESSGTLLYFDYSGPASSLAELNHQDQTFWLRNSAFIKGYVFDRAAFLKIGIKTLLSPRYYRSRNFNTSLGFWQGSGSYQELPPFFRLDGELSARVRRIMIVLRMENALDGIGQAGYFETAGYPMPPRRLMVGIRAQFRN